MIGASPGPCDSLDAMLDSIGGTRRRLDFGFVPSPSGGGMHAVQEEGVHNS